jgi:hypothetical protein
MSYFHRIKLMVDRSDSESYMQMVEKRLAKQTEDIRREHHACVCCGEPVVHPHPDPWGGRMDDYCEGCSWVRCDAYPGACMETADE